MAFNVAHRVLGTHFSTRIVQALHLRRRSLVSLEDPLQQWIFSVHIFDQVDATRPNGRSHLNESGEVMLWNVGTIVQKNISSPPKLFPGFGGLVATARSDPNLCHGDLVRPSAESSKMFFVDRKIVDPIIDTWAFCVVQEEIFQITRFALGRTP